MSALGQLLPGDRVRYKGYRFREHFAGKDGKLSPCPTGEVLAKVEGSEQKYVVDFRGEGFILTPQFFEVCT